MKAIIIDDEPLARIIVKEYLQKYPQLELVQECNDGFEGLKAIQQHQPDRDGAGGQHGYRSRQAGRH